MTEKEPLSAAKFKDVSRRRPRPGPEPRQSPTRLPVRADEFVKDGLTAPRPCDQGYWS